MAQGLQEQGGRNGVHLSLWEVGQPLPPFAVHHISFLLSIFQFNLIIICHKGFGKHLLPQLCPSLSLVFKE